MSASVSTASRGRYSRTPGNCACTSFGIRLDIEPVARALRRGFLVAGIGLRCRLVRVGDAVAVGVELCDLVERREIFPGVLELLPERIQRRAAAVLVTGVAGRWVAVLLF